MKRMKRRIGVILAVMLVMALVPVSSFAEITSVSFKTQPSDVTVTEGQITETLTCSAQSAADEGVAISYKWYSCKSNGDIIQEIGDADDDENVFQIPEELTGGKVYYYKCRATAFGVISEETKSVDSDVAKVTVEPGTKYVIFDPNEGSFPEILNPKDDLKVVIGADGKISGADMPPGPPFYRDGYKFVGWYTKDEVLVEDPLKETYEHTTRLIARYQEYQTFIFDANGGVFEYGGDTYSATCVNGNLPVAEMPEEPAREGYKFLGWYSKYPDGTEFEVVPDEYGNINFMMETSLEQNVYAKWEKVAADKDDGDKDKKPADDINEKDSEKKPEVVNDNSPDTGDSSNNIAVHAAAMILALCGAAALNRRKA